MKLEFGAAVWFWAFALFPVLIACFFLNEQRRGKLLRQLVAARLQDRLAGTVSVPRRRLRFGLLLLGMAGVILSLTQPRLGETWEQTKRQGRDVLIAIDCSRSMLATDLAPSRLARAKMAAQDFIGQLRGDRVGLIAFAGSSFLQAPLTIDYGAVLTSLAEIDTDVIPRGGTNITAAIKEAVDAFGKGESDNRCLIIFTDGEELYADAVTAAAAQNGKIKIFTVGLGSANGSLIPMPGANGTIDYVKDENGQIVKSKLDEDRLRKIAEATGGFYVHLDNGPGEMQQIYRSGLGQMKEQEIDVRMTRRPIERYQWPLGAGLVSLVISAFIGERRRGLPRRAGALMTAAVVALTFWVPSGAWAKDLGMEAYQRGDYKGAIDEFNRQIKKRGDLPQLHFNVGAAAFEKGELDKALESFGKAVTSTNPQLQADAEYNIGNILLDLGAKTSQKDEKVNAWKGAIEHYDQALRLRPKDEDAQYNRDLVAKLLEDLQRPPPPQQQQDKNDQQQNDQKKQKDQKDQQDSKDQKQDQQKKEDQQKKDGQKEKDQQSQGGKPDEQSQQDGKPDKDQQSQQGQGEEKKDQPPKNEGKADGKQSGPAEQQKQDQQGGQGKDQEKKDQAQPKDGRPENAPQGQPQDGKSAQNGAKPGDPHTPADQPDRKREGDIRAQGDQPPPPDAKQEEAAEIEAAAAGKMTENQATKLLDSLKSEDDRVQLLHQGERKQPRPLRDW